MSMIDLFQELNEVAGENLQLFTRHIQQDYLEQFFCIVRQRCGANDNPTAVQFKYAIRRLLALGVGSFKPSKDGNCSVDNNEQICEEAEDFNWNDSFNLPADNDPFVELEIYFRSTSDTDTASDDGEDRYFSDPSPASIVLGHSQLLADNEVNVDLLKKH